MDDVRDDSVPDNFIILSPEELAKLGINIKKPVLTPTDHGSNPEYVKTGGSVETITYNVDIKTEDQTSDLTNNLAPCKVQTDKSKFLTDDNSVPGLKAINLPLLVQKGKKGKPNKSDITLIKKSRLTYGKSGLKSLNSGSDESSKIGTSNSLNDSNPSSSQVSIKAFDTKVQKRGKGRPRKSASYVNQDDSGNADILLSHNVSKTSRQLTSNQQQDNSRNSNCNDAFDLPTGNKFRKGRIKKYRIFDSDTSSNSDLNEDNDSDSVSKSKTKKRKRAQIFDSDDSDVSVSSDKLKLHNSKQKQVKIEASSDSEVPISNDVNVSLEMSNESLNCEETKTTRKRGRPKKNSLEVSKKIVPSIPMNKHGEMDDSLVTISRRGRKRKEVNYSLLDNPDLLEHDGNNGTKRGHGTQYRSRGNVNDNRNNDCSSSNTEEPKDVPKEEVEEVPEQSSEVNKNSVKSSSGYKWTGNATKALNQIFNAIMDNNVSESSHDPLLGKIKRRGRPKESTDNVIDQDGSSVCMVCNETIPNSEWSQHKRKVHYNLAWRKGDYCMDVTNETFVLNTFKQLIKEIGYIKCNRCAEKITNAKKFICHLEICNGVVNSSGCVTCAVCKTTLGKSSWQYHNYKQHNNLAWREGDPPLNLEDQDLVIRILNGLYKAKKPLHCEKCGLQKKSVLGFLSHKSTCQKTEEELSNLKVTCDICGKKVLPISMDYHLKAHEGKEAKNSSLHSSYFDVDVDITGKREAAKQALQVISSITGQPGEETKYYIAQSDFQDTFVTDVLRKRLLEHSPLTCIFVDCDFSSELVESMVDHMNSCERKPEQYFLCKMCLSWCKEESEIHEHIKMEHKKSFKGNQDTEFHSGFEQNESEEDEFLDDNDREKKRLRLNGKNKIINQGNVRVKPLFLVHPIRESLTTLLYRQAYAWTLEFCGIHFNNVNLYQSLRNHEPWPVLDCNILSNYLPENSQSCDITAKIIRPKEVSADYGALNFIKLELFEVKNLYDGDVTIYCGGPISALAWLPTPHNNKNLNQVLAVAVFNSMESYYAIDKNYYEPVIIQFWDFGILDCHEKNGTKPSLLFGMAVPFGPIWHLEWCPSGCLDSFQEDTTCRLGLLAVAASDSFVYIYSVDNLPDANDRGCIYKGEAVLKLQLESERNTLAAQAYFPTKISWSKAGGHRYIAVGYSTGFVALYDLSNESLLLQRGDKTGTNIVFPYTSFQAHYSSITGITLSHLSGGNRFLFTCSFDRTSLYWDLSTTTKIMPLRKQTMSDGLWMTHWPTYLVAEDESTSNDTAFAHTYYKALRQPLGSDSKNFTVANSGIRTLSFSDWLNTILHGSNAGEVMGQFTHRMFCGIDTRMFKSSYTKCIFSLTKMVKREGSSSDMAVTYEESAKKYKLAFLDYSLGSLENTPNSSPSCNFNRSSLSKCDITEYSLQGINKVAFNPNLQACSYYAVGYQAGFVRLQWIKFVSPLLKKF